MWDESSGWKRAYDLRGDDSQRVMDSFTGSSRTGSGVGTILAKIPEGIPGRMEECVMETALSVSKDFTALCEGENILISGGGQEQGWDYELAEYLGVGIGYGVKKLWKAFKILSSGLYKMRNTPLLLYQ